MMWWRIRAAWEAAWEALTQEYEEPKPSGVYDLQGNFLRPFDERDRGVIRGNLYNGVSVQDAEDA